MAARNLPPPPTGQNAYIVYALPAKK